MGSVAFHFNIQLLNAVFEKNLGARLAETRLTERSPSALRKDRREIVGGYYRDFVLLDHVTRGKQAGSALLKVSYTQRFNSSSH